MYRNIAQVSLLATISTLAISSSSYASATKVSECNSMLAVANKAATANKKFTTQAEALSRAGKFKDTSQSIPLFKTLSGEIAVVGKEMNSLKITDKKLKGMQTKFVDLYQGMSKGLDTAVVDLTNKDPEAFSQNWEKFGRVVAKEEPLVNEINEYCNFKK